MDVQIVPNLSSLSITGFGVWELTWVWTLGRRSWHYGGSWFQLSAHIFLVSFNTIKQYSFGYLCMLPLWTLCSIAQYPSVTTGYRLALLSMTTELLASKCCPSASALWSSVILVGGKGASIETASSTCRGQQLLSWSIPVTLPHQHISCCLVNQKDLWALLGNIVGFLIFIIKPF